MNDEEIGFIGRHEGHQVAVEINLSTDGLEAQKARQPVLTPEGERGREGEGETDIPLGSRARLGMYVREPGGSKRLGRVISVQHPDSLDNRISVAWEGNDHNVKYSPDRFDRFLEERKPLAGARFTEAQNERFLRMFGEGDKYLRSQALKEIRPSPRPSPAGGEGEGENRDPVIYEGKPIVGAVVSALDGKIEETVSEEKAAALGWNHSEYLCQV